MRYHDHPVDYNATRNRAHKLPIDRTQGPVGGVNSNSSADGVASSSLSGDSANVQAGDRLEAYYSGNLVRVNLSDFTAAGVEVCGSGYFEMAT